MPPAFSATEAPLVGAGAAAGSPVQPMLIKQRGTVNRNSARSINLVPEVVWTEYFAVRQFRIVGGIEVWTKLSLQFALDVANPSFPVQHYFIPTIRLPLDALGR